MPMTITNRTAHLSMGVLFFLIFNAIGLTMLLNPQLEAISLIEKSGIGPQLLACFFIVSGWMNGIAGYKQYIFNPIWFSPMILFTAATWGTVIQEQGEISPVPALAYTLLCGMYLIDYLRDNNAAHRIAQLEGDN